MRKFNYEEDVEYYLKSIYKIPLLSKDEEEEILSQIKEGKKEALHRLIQGNLRFVVNIAKRYAGYNIPFQELISAGNLGLVEAAQRYDPSKGVKFISYAVWWIKQSIMELINKQTDIIKKPQKSYSIFSKIDNAYIRLKEELQREPTFEEIENFIKEEGIDKDIIKSYFLNKKYFVSLDEPIDTDDEDMILSDLISNYGTEDIEKDILEDDIKYQLNKLLDYLSPREKKIIIHRYGLDGEEPKTLKEVGDILGISRERVRQIEVRALKKLKKLAKKHSIEDLIK
ncbi:RNA polymerase sigma factor RpoD/SigA [Venenivibrio stagnispumantis]|uniref:RNA polymerase sigma factor n=1 Tax=Venenivibrio stagnispumantis TaxID=407998 RepID=A0AA46ADT9_9AQUI|nr:RNA polymerase sigma factor RpoD/SigA [Venenivibrio stagnispumantis]MCW4573005.1 RNA polymerase sigma factor RpoD/SigA [Venenivibrio stagnispumantis]SMP07838.1 RNA polymerase primary sigma factor [Venenivibrio stagnispumantis]